MHLPAFRLVTFLAGLSLLAGCSVFTPPLKRPNVTDYQNGNFQQGRDFGTSSLTASRRMVMFKLQNKGYLRVCAEPPPAVGEQLSSAFQLAAEAALKKTATEKDASAQLSTLSTLSTSLVKLEKAKGIQYEQDLLYALCQMYMNGAVNKHETLALFRDITERAEGILLAEIAAEQGPGKQAGPSGISNRTPRLDDKSKVALQFSDPAALNAYHTIEVIARGTDGIASGSAWQSLGSPTVSKSDGMVTIAWNASTVKLSGKKPEAVELAVRITPTANGEALIYPAAEKSVYYPGNAAATAKLSPAKAAFFDNRQLELSLTMPAHFEIGYPKFDVGKTLIQAVMRNHVNDVVTRQTFAANPAHAATGEYLWVAQLPPSVAKEIDEARGVGNVRVKLSFSDPGPAIGEVTLDQWTAPADIAQVNKPIRSNEGKTVVITWKPGSGENENITYEVSMYLSNGAVHAPPTITRATEYQRNDLDPEKTYRVTITPIHQTRRGNPANKEIAK